MKACSDFNQPFSLNPAPPWVGWEHDLGGLWPPPDDRSGDLNETVDPWLDGLGGRARARLMQDRTPRVIGHSDWYQPNISWAESRLLAVHDWDSLALLSEAAIAGAAASTFTVWDGGSTSIDEGEEFLLAYERARRRPWSRDEREIAWAAGLWLLAFNAKKESLEGDGVGQQELRVDGEARRKLANA